MAKNTTKSTKNTSTKKSTKSDNKAKSTSKKGLPLIGDNTVFNLTIKWSDVKKGKKIAINKARQQLKRDGFRQGQVPEALVIKAVGQQYIVENTLQTILPEAYQKYLQEHKLFPLTEPAIKPIKMEDDQDWELEVSIAVKPEITLDNYDQIVKKLKKNHQLWTKKPTKNAANKTNEKQTTKPEDSPEQIKQEQIRVILTALLEKIAVPVPELLLRRETEQQLHHFAHQLEHLKMTMEDFLQKSGQTMEQLQQDYATRSLGGLQVELLLGAIIAKENIKVSESEVVELLETRLANVPEEKRESLKAREAQYAHATLLKQKALDHLLNL